MKTQDSPTIDITIHYACEKKRFSVNVENLAHAKRVLRERKDGYTTGLYKNSKGFTKLLEA